MWRTLKAYIKSESGQTSTEYLLLVGVVAIIVFKFKETAQTQLKKITEGVFGAAENKIMNEINNIP